ncbi:hypothetical protein EPH95_12140 [Salicibibacter halophilus]|uniref:Flagellar protein n=1 Tax=Salicibibacter halophilus TaxID=2502791 RepID=A0A514LJ27_9BACI|nr:hypothetical protein EPH95_12140 [Salicibibacter halophilus]
MFASEVKPVIGKWAATVKHSEKVSDMIDTIIFGGATMTELANCPACGALYVKTAIALCNRCRQSKEERFDKVYRFLKKKENRTSTISRAVAHTGVAETEILGFIREGRLQLTDLPNFHMPCSFCGEATRNGRLCKSCEKRLQADMASLNNTKETAEADGYVNKQLHSRKYE